MNIVRRIIFVLVSLFCLLSIMSYPINKYEWMMEEDPQITIKNLPIDHNASIYPWLAIAPVILLITSILITKSKKEKKIVILIGVILLSIWAYRYRSLLF